MYPILRSVVLSAGLCAIAVSSSAAPAESEEVRLLKAQVAALETRLARLETQAPGGAAVPVQTLAAPVATAAATNDSGVIWKADVRYRHDYQDGPAAERHRERVRARIGFAREVQTGVDLGFGLTTGSDPISANQTLDDGLTRKDVNIDYAYIGWRPEQWQGSSIIAGKFKQNFTNVGGAALLWDNDVMAEGMAASYETGGDRWKSFLTLAGWWLDERSSAADSLVFGVQGSVTHDLPFAASALTVGASYFDYRATQGRTPFTPGGAGLGNTLDGAGNYAFDFNDLEVFAEWNGLVGPAKGQLFIDWVRNLDGGRDDTGFALGASLAHQDLSLRYVYKDLDANAVVAAFTDSDYGVGGSDIRGHLLGAGYKITSKVDATFNWFFADSSKGGPNTQDVDRVFFDLQVKL